MLPKLFKSFRPPRAATLTLFLLACVFATLGTWQQKRALEKKEIELQHQVAGPLSLEKAIAQNSRFSTVNASGHYDVDRHVLLDNQVWQGRPGVYVFTPFYTTKGATILVNRGWLPLAADRKSLPMIPTPQNQVILKGILNTPPVPGRMLGAADQLDQDNWPQLVTYLNLKDISESMGTPLETWVVQLSKSEPDGFEGRDWKPVYLNSSRHQGYAFQWYALLAACVVMWVYLGFRKPPGISK
ncbi:MAG: SURF1 family protein [Lysobacterales bacterium]